MKLLPGIIAGLVLLVSSSGGCTCGKSTILFLGDSITEAEFFARDFEATWNAEQPDQPVRVIPRGRGGESVSGLTEPKFPGRRPQGLDRVDKELRRFKPDWVVACYGMNCGLFQPFETNRFQAYQAGISALVQRLLDHGAKVVLLTPPPFALPGAVTNSFATLAELTEAVTAAHAEGRSKTEREPERYGYFSPYRYYDDVLAVYSAWLKTRTQTGRVWVVDMRTPLLAARDVAYDPDDPVHPNREGHRIMAETLLQSWKAMDDGLKTKD